MSLKRKLERTKKKTAEKELKQKVSMFDKMPDACVSCFKDFDKRNREMVKTWTNEKTTPDPYEIPDVEDYVVDKPTIPKEEE